MTDPIPNEKDAPFFVDQVDRIVEYFDSCVEDLASFVPRKCGRFHPITIVPGDASNSEATANKTARQAENKEPVLVAEADQIVSFTDPPEHADHDSSPKEALGGASKRGRNVNGVERNHMDRRIFDESLKGEQPPNGLTRVLKALWYDAKGKWDAAHEEAQAQEDRDGAWVHAYLHRKEGDQGNAAYWYRQAGKPVCTQTLGEEWEQLVEAFVGTGGS
jgi:hypothetical protein